MITVNERRARQRTTQRCGEAVVVRYPQAVRDAAERAAADQLCSMSDIIRRATVRGMRAEGLLNEPMA
jgi:hypothetical protein